MKTYLLIILLLSFACYGLFVWFRQSPEVKITGVSLVNPRQEIDAAKMAEVKRINADWIAVIPIAFIQNNNPEVHFDRPHQWWGERLGGTAKMIQLARQHDLKVMLKPHLWMRGGWVGDFDLDSEKKWKQWELNYSRYIQANLHLADSLEVEMFCVGTELRLAVEQRKEFWEDLIIYSRLRYSGLLTYAANWDDFHRVPFWGHLDYVGINGYFPIAKQLDPSTEELEEGWYTIRDQLDAFASEQQKPILFTEYGYRSSRGATGNHWEINHSNAQIDLEIQVKAYEALYQELWNEQWFAGGFLWKWHFSEGAGGMNNFDFTPQGKPAEKTISKWYGTPN